MKYLSIRETSVASANIFRKENQIITDYSFALTETTEELMFLLDNRKYAPG